MNAHWLLCHLPSHASSPWIIVIAAQRSLPPCIVVIAAHHCCRPCIIVIISHSQCIGHHHHTSVIITVHHCHHHSSLVVTTYQSVTIQLPNSFWYNMATIVSYTYCMYVRSRILTPVQEQILGPVRSAALLHSPHPRPIILYTCVPWRVRHTISYANF